MTGYQPHKCDWNEPSILCQLTLSYKDINNPISRHKCHQVYMIVFTALFTGNKQWQILG